MYWKYFLYVIEHKFNVFIECLKMGMIVHGIVHDLSKFLPSEFIPYAKYFYGKNGKEKYKNIFEIAWNHHQKRNKHHWNYWVRIDGHEDILPIPMPEKYVKQMIADWSGMSRKFGGEAYEYFEKHKREMMWANGSLIRIEKIFYPDR